MINPISITDERVGQATEIEQTVPIRIIARQSRDFQAEHDAHLAEADLGGHAREAGSLGKAGAGNTEVLIDDLHLIASPTEPRGAFGQLVLTGSGLAIMLDLRRTGLTHVDDCASAEVLSSDLAQFVHRCDLLEERLLGRLVGRVAARDVCAALYRGPPIRVWPRAEVVGRESLAAAWLSSDSGGRTVCAASNCRSKASTIVRACSSSALEARNAARAHCGLARGKCCAIDRSVHAAGTR